MFMSDMPRDPTEAAAAVATREISAGGGEAHACSCDGGAAEAGCATGGRAETASATGAAPAASGEEGQQASDWPRPALFGAAASAGNAAARMSQVGAVASYEASMAAEEAGVASAKHAPQLLPGQAELGVLVWADSGNEGHLADAVHH